MGEGEIGLRLGLREVGLREGVERAQRALLARAAVAWRALRWRALRWRALWSYMYMHSRSDIPPCLARRHQALV